MIDIQVFDENGKALHIDDVISRLFSELATKHNVKVDDLNLHISYNTLYIQEYTPNGLTEYNCLEMVDLNGLYHRNIRNKKCYEND